MATKIRRCEFGWNCNRIAFRIVNGILTCKTCHAHSTKGVKR